MKVVLKFKYVVQYITAHLHWLGIDREHVEGACRRVPSLCYSNSSTCNSRVFELVPGLSLAILLQDRYSSPCILRPPIQPEKHGLKLKVVLKWKDIYIENITCITCIRAGVTDNLNLKMEGIVKWKGLKSKGPL